MGHTGNPGCSDRAGLGRPRARIGGRSRVPPRRGRPVDAAAVEHELPRNRHRARARRQCARTAPGRRAAGREDGLANWGSEGKLQWCASGPGIVSAARDYLDEELLLAGAELVWRAGAPGVEKGHGICHGTSGNGFALLAAFERTQDELWLDRARRFAVHALGQAARVPARYSLFTGGAGTALFVAACLDGDARYPVLERNRRAD